MLERINRILPLPYPHFMALAPLDVWARMLWRGGTWRRISPRYWIRIAGGLFTSTLGTVLTLPERVAFGLWARAVRPRPVKVLCVLGYFRSGTTHLHYLLSCDPAFCTPRWYQALAPQGFAASWAFLRWFFVPFLASTRPQDDVAIGPEWPAEDDFALCNWSLSSSMPGRMVLPNEWERCGSTGGGGGGWKRLHNLDDLTGTELSRWRRHVRAFAWKMSRLSGGRMVVLKNPSHTGRVRALVEVFGEENTRFIHLTREPADVVRSNVSMHQRFDPYLLQPHPGDDEIRRRIIDEYDRTERAFLREAAELPRGMVSRLRYQDLVADPIGELKRAYSDLGLNWTDAAEQACGEYLTNVRDYRAAGSGKSEGAKSASPPCPDLEWMRAADAFDHERPAPPRASAAASNDETSAGRAAADASPDRLQTAAVTLAVALLCAAAWVAVARLANDRLDWLTWPVGVALGTLAIRITGRGSGRLGMWAGALTLFVLLAAAYPATSLVFYRDRPWPGEAGFPWWDAWDSTRDGLLAINNMVWMFLGIVSAYRLASRRQPVPPGGRT